MKGECCWGSEGSQGAVAEGCSGFGEVGFDCPLRWIRKWENIVAVSGRTSYWMDG